MEESTVNFSLAYGRGVGSCSGQTAISTRVSSLTIRCKVRVRLPGRTRTVIAGHFNNQHWQRVYVLAYGQTYEGGFQNGQMHGQVLMYLQMAGCQGAFGLGKKNGNGTFSWPNGNRYTGSFADGQRQGDGVFLADGMVYRGQFLANKQHGYGYGAAQQSFGASAMKTAKCFWRGA